MITEKHVNLPGPKFKNSVCIHVYNVQNLKIVFFAYNYLTLTFEDDFYCRQLSMAADAAFENRNEEELNRVLRICTSKDRQVEDKVKYLKQQMVGGKR